jgi:arylsulfatase A-like enzyme
MANRAIDWIRMQHAIAPDKPFFMYFAPGNGHAPHHGGHNFAARSFHETWIRINGKSPPSAIAR